jgi:plastocyanin
VLVLVPIVATPVHAGSVVGQVVFRGEVPPPATIDVLKDHEVCGLSVSADALVVDPKTRGVAHAVVSIDGVTASAPPAREVTLENRRCRFVPRVLALQVGAELAIVNADPVLHNLRAWLDRRAVLNVVQPTQGQVTQRTIKRPGAMTLTCDTHTHMTGALLAFEHPFFALSDAAGRFRIDGVPAGAYTVRLWHEGWKILTRDREGRVQYEPPHVLAREVTVPDEGEVQVRFELAPRP